MKHVIWKFHLYKEDINISIVKLIVISKKLICNRYLINVTNNSDLSG